MSSITFIISAVFTVFLLHSFDESNIAAESDSVILSVQTLVDDNKTNTIQSLSENSSSLKTGVITQKRNDLPSLTNVSDQASKKLQVSTI